MSNEIWRSIDQLSSDVIQVSRLKDGLFLLNGNMEYAIGEARIQNAGGESDMNATDLAGMIGALRQADSGGAPLDRAIEPKNERLRQIEAQCASAEDYPVERIERDIWVLWISSLSVKDSNILDLDEIEDHLRSIGVLSSSSFFGLFDQQKGQLDVDFGSYTSEEDELAAISTAQREAEEIRGRYRQIAQPGQ